MSKSMEGNLRQEVWDCLRSMGLHSGSIADCTRLSREIRFLTGRKISASTLYRMLNPEAQKVAPSSYSRSTVLSFLEVLQQAGFQRGIREGEGGFNAFSHSALFPFVVQEFRRESQGFEDWFKSLPVEHWATGDDQVVIGHALAEVLASDRGALRSAWKRRLLLTPQFRTFYSETYVDLNAPTGAYLEILRLQFDDLHRDLARTGGDLPISTRESMLFNLSIRAFLWYLMGNEKGVAEFKSYVQSPSFHWLQRDFGQLSLLPRIRFLCMEWLVTRSVPLRKERFHRIRAALKEHFEGVINPQLREFAFCILVDALLLGRDLEGVYQVLSEVPAPRVTFLRGEPSISRMGIYRNLFEGNRDEGLLELQETALAVGGNELVYSKLMVQLAKQLKMGMHKQSEASLCINQSGFKRFNTLLS